MPKGFVAWAIPLLSDPKSAELASDGLREFLKSPASESFATLILAACKDFLEDDRTSLPVLRSLLSLLTFIAYRFPLSFQPHFVDIVDLLLGWAFVPDSSEDDIGLIMNSFEQFKWHWLNNLPFLHGLLTKFLGDMEVLLHDNSLSAADDSYGRLPSLLSCFSTVLQVAASSASDASLLQEIVSPLESMAPRLLQCTNKINVRFGSSKWAGESWRCLVVLAEMLSEKFAEFYETTASVIFEHIRRVCSQNQLQVLLKINMQLLSLQNLALRASSVRFLLHSQSALSLLRLHPNYTVAASSAAAYLFLLQHGSYDVVSQAISSLLEELELLKGMIVNVHLFPHHDSSTMSLSNKLCDQAILDLRPISECSEHELVLLICFDLKALLASISFSHGISPSDSSPTVASRCEMATRLILFISEKLSPFDPFIEGLPELQSQVFHTLRKLNEAELMNSFTTATTSWNGERSGLCDQSHERVQIGCLRNLWMNCLNKNAALIVLALHASSSIALKQDALDWIIVVSKRVLSAEKDVNRFTDSLRSTFIDRRTLLSLLNLTIDREHKIRGHVGTSLEALLLARLIDPMDYPALGQVVLDKLADPEPAVRSAFLRLTSIALPVTAMLFGLLEHGSSLCKSLPGGGASKHYARWKSVLALRQLSRKLHCQQLVAVLSYLSQRLRVPLSSWASRVVFAYRGRIDTISGYSDVPGDADAGDILRGLDMEEDLINRYCSVNPLAAVWLSIHEAARHCIALRLRTNLGGPTQTFAAIERMLLDVPSILASETEHGDTRYSESSDSTLLPMRLLLEFVEALKKNIYNSYEGSFILPSPHKQSTLFFGANKRVCEEWFSRICEPLLNAALALHCHDATIHYCRLRLLDLRNLAASSLKDRSHAVGPSDSYSVSRETLEADVLRVLQHASLALCKCRDADSLVGLQKWAVSSFPLLFNDANQQEKLSWMSGVVYQAQGQYEKAAAHYTLILQSEDALSAVGSCGIQFIISRVIECYTSLSDWKVLESWLSELQALRAAKTGKHYSGALTTAGNELNAIHALACFDVGNTTAAWGYLDLTPKSSTQYTLDSKVALERSEQMLLRAMLQYDENNFSAWEELEKAKLMLNEVWAVLSLDGLSAAATHSSQLHCIFAFEEAFKSVCHDEISHSLSTFISSHLWNSFDRNQDCSIWMKLLRVYRTVQPSSWSTLFLCQKLVSLSRKQNNYLLAKRLNQYIVNHPLTHPMEKYQGFFNLKVQFEGILLKHAEGLVDDAINDLWLFVRPHILSTNNCTSHFCALLMAKACLRFSTWLESERRSPASSNIMLAICDEYMQHFMSVDAPGMVLSSSGTGTPSVDQSIVVQEIIGVATKESCRLSPTMGKSWLSYASWCFNQARDSFSSQSSSRLRGLFSPVLQPELSADRHQLTDTEMSLLEDAVRNFFLKDEVNPLETVDTAKAEDSGNVSERELVISSLVKQSVHLLEAAAEFPGYEACEVECPSSLLSSEVKTLFSGYNTKVESLEALIGKIIEVWWSLRVRRVSLYRHAADGYFQYLTHKSSELHSSCYYNVSNEKNRCSGLRALLYILHIILNYGFELRESLEAGLSMAPLLAWQEVIPQLYARLGSHPEKTTRKILEGILTKLGKLSPSAVVYPTLVDVNAAEGNPSEELQRILGFMSKLYPKLIQDVKLVIDELGMCTVLWEEQWLSTLQDLHSDALRRVNILKDEYARVAAHSTLSHAEKNKINATKYCAIMTPIIVALERRLASTSRDPKTAHETWFQKEYGARLSSAISSLKIPPDSAALLGQVWRPFECIASSLVTHQKKSCVLLSDVAPQLATLCSSAIPMPGFEKRLHSSLGISDESPDIITVSSFCEQVTVLPTKTKPKKLVLQGSDGQKYTYLLKGREDLRLDARIMQLLEAVNSLLYTSHDSRLRDLRVQFYSVTPISGWAGLIQWVDNVSSMYNVYKSWQKRTQLTQNITSGAGNIANHVLPIPRPSDMFYGKIIPALKGKGIKRVTSRRDWPLDVKREVLLELMKETPRQILWQELWCSSDGFKCFNSKIKRFSGSIAAMSIIGHILGLGDRHLDNILMDFSTGDVVHIDYNICFDKGKRLKIPEIVPFRLTQTIEAALGLTGVEGAFRANCEAVLNALVANKDIILMLLEVFVWDPLMEWTRGNSQDEAGIAGEEKKGMDLAVSLSLFASRVQEIRIPLQEIEDRLGANLPLLELALMRFLDVLSQYEVVSAIFYHLEKERTRLLKHETSVKSLLSEAATISEKAQASYELHARELAQAKAVAVVKAQDLAKWVQQHGGILDALRDNSIPRDLAIDQLKNNDEALSLSSAVLVAGVPLTVVPEPTRAQCCDLDKDLTQFVSEMVNEVVCCMEALKEYAFVLQMVLPPNYLTTSLLSGWAQMFQLLVNNLSPDMLAHAKRQASDLLSRVQGEASNVMQQRYKDLLNNMETCIGCAEKLSCECADLMNTLRSEKEVQSRDRLMSALMSCAQLISHPSNAGVTNSVLLQGKHDMHDSEAQEDIQPKLGKMFSVLGLAISEMYYGVRVKLIDLSGNTTGMAGSAADYDAIGSGISMHLFEEQIEKCALLSGVVQDVQSKVKIHLSNATPDVLEVLSGTWVSAYQTVLRASSNLIEQITESVLPELVRSFISHNRETMEAFGILTQLRGSIYSAVEKLIDIELERTSLLDLEHNFLVNVGVITEKQAALEKASTMSRDHLSWEEAEELVTQEEACKAQLEQLHLKWSQKDARVVSLEIAEGEVMNSLRSYEQYFASFLGTEHNESTHMTRGKSLLATIAKPFFELNSLDSVLATHGIRHFNLMQSKFSPEDLSSTSLAEIVWPMANILKHHAFFVWKVGLIELVLDTCMTEISSSAENNISSEQLYIHLKKKLATQLEGYICQYVKQRVACSFISQLDNEVGHLRSLSEHGKDSVVQGNGNSGFVGKIVVLLEEYCNAHETFRDAKVAVALMQRNVNELTEALRKMIMEVVQLEWLYGFSSSQLLKERVISLKLFNDDIYSVILNINRKNIIEKLQLSISSLARTRESIQVFEKISASAEGKLERAMTWACGITNNGPAGNSAKSSGIPPEFHGHLLKRRQLIRAALEEASDIMNICSSVLEFEASRDGVFLLTDDQLSRETLDKNCGSSQAFMNCLMQLSSAYNSYARSEQELKLCQHNMEAAATGLFSASNQLSVVATKSKSALADLQESIVSMYESASEVSKLLSSFKHISKDQTTLTSECNALLDEVLASGEGLHDVFASGKAAASTHSALTESLSKVNVFLLPLEASLSTDLDVMAEVMSKERENNTSIILIHGKALYQSYVVRVREACHEIRTYVPSVIHYVKELQSMLINLGRVSSQSAGNLHKALEGLGGSQVVGSANSPLSKVDTINGDSSVYKGQILLETHEVRAQDLSVNTNFLFQEEVRVSPPEYSYTSSAGSSSLSRISSLEDFEKEDHAFTDGALPGIDKLACCYSPTAEMENILVQGTQSDSCCSIISKDMQKQDFKSTEEAGAVSLHGPGNTSENNGKISTKENGETPVEPVIEQRCADVQPKKPTDNVDRAARGKNKFALAVLKQIEHKLAGTDIDVTRSMTISEQVDHLIKQATSIENLCNMYEGWTPWI